MAPHQEPNLPKILKHDTPEGKWAGIIRRHYHFRKRKEDLPLKIANLRYERELFSEFPCMVARVDRLLEKYQGFLVSIEQSLEDCDRLLLLRGKVIEKEEFLEANLHLLEYIIRAGNPLHRYACTDDSAKRIDFL